MSKNQTVSTPVKAIRLIDTCILCEILNVPGKSNKAEHDVCAQKFNEFRSVGGRFVLPLATLIETGNHIAQNGNGNQRRAVANTFVKFVQAAMKDESPFLRSEIWKAHVKEWLAEYPDSAMRGIGLGDVSIQKDCEIVKQTCGVSGIPVEIWTKDKHNA